MGKYFSLVKNKRKREATLNIFGDITSTPSSESDISDYNILKQLEGLGEVDTIHVRLNSYGGEVGTGLSIYNALKNHKAKVITYVDGFACSVASVIFMSGDERVMNPASLLMVHNAWSIVQGNANELRKQADDLDIITQASINAYLERVSISESKLRELLDNETWLTPEQCLEMGFATKVTESKNSDKASQNVRQSLVKMILDKQDVTEKTLDKLTIGEWTFVPREGGLGAFFKQEETTSDVEIDNEEGGEAVKLECQSCGYVHEDELPEFFVCPECGADKEQFVEVEETETEEVEEAETTEDEEVVEPETTEEEPEKDEETTEEVDEEEGKNEKAVAFFKGLIGGLK